MRGRAITLSPLGAAQGARGYIGQRLTRTTGPPRLQTIEPRRPVAELAHHGPLVPDTIHRHVLLTSSKLRVGS